MIFTMVVALALTSQVSEKVMSLKEMCEDSETIFVGQVAKISHTSIAKIDVVEIEFVKVKCHKGGKDQPFVVKQANLTFRVAPLKSGDWVFWFLLPPSEVGLRVPIGSENGDFRIVPDQTKKSRFSVMNRRNNRGLDIPEFKDGDSIDLALLEVTVDKLLVKKISPVETPPAPTPPESTSPAPTPPAPSKSLPGVPKS